MPLLHGRIDLPLFLSEGRLGLVKQPQERLQRRQKVRTSIYSYCYLSRN